LLLGADQVVLVGDDHLLVGFDGLDRPSREAAELVGAVLLGLLHQVRFHHPTLLGTHAGW
jgi:hypothetical protein